MSLARRIRALLERYDAHPKKSYGQNFLIDENILEKIADLGSEGAAAVVEIGPGLGTLTAALLARGVEVVAVEKDPAMVEILRAELDDPRLRIIHRDILDVRYTDVAPGAHVVGNIPYNVSAPILIGLVKQRADIGPATLMIQREVAERIASAPDSKSYGSLSVMIQMHADVKCLLQVPPTCFRPAPKVDSTVIRLRWLPEPRFAIPSSEALEKVARAAFVQRRKMLRNTLKTAFSPAAILKAGAESGLDLKRRAESLSLQEFAALTRALSGP